MSARKRSRKTGKGRAKAGRAGKKLTARKKGISPKKTATRTVRGRRAKRKGAKAPSPPVRARAAHDERPATRPEGAPVDVVEVTTLEMVAVRDPFARP